MGAIATPGVYTLPPDACVHDAIAAAGGATREADLTRVNLAEPLRDGASVDVPCAGETILVWLAGKVNLNSASEQDLRYALSISLTIAKRIVAYRDAHGPFTAVSQLLLVPISRSEYDRIKDLVTV
jgi:competence protein ComEA